MLYDPKWEQKTKADPFSLETLIAWLERQPSRGVYDYCDPHNCLLCQYFRAQGFAVDSITWNVLRQKDGSHIEFPSMFHWNIANDPKETFGAALERARQMLEQDSREMETKFHNAVL